LDDLLDAMAARFLAGIDLTDTDGPWPDRMRRAATELHDRMRSRPELTELVLSRAPTIAAGPALLRRFEEILIRAGVPDTVAHLAWHVVLTVVIGSLRQERARDQNQTDTFEAVLDVAVAGLVAIAAGPLEARPLALLESHGRER
ncbi:MAG TPA: hypothetical protein VHZ97_29950, partial [Pseudonocardiaceae bacterium]|nr:hypothetical protein [Pseudonocardiaceae bacterium]